MNFEDRERQIENLRQVIRRSESAILALRTLVRQTEGRLRQLQADPPPSRIPQPPVPARPAPKESPGLQMFR